MWIKESKIYTLAQRWLVMIFALLVVAVMICVAQAAAPIARAEDDASAESTESTPIETPLCDAQETEEVAEAVSEAAAGGTLEKIKEDLSAFDLGNKDARRVSLANFFAGYDGQLVFFGNWANRRSGSFGRLMGLYGNDKYYPEILKHEHGHYEQYKRIGLLKYIFAIAIPSIKNDPARDYYSQLWEVTADLLGGVTTHRHTPGSEEAGMQYLQLVEEKSLLVSIIFALAF